MADSLHDSPLDEQIQRLKKSKDTTFSESSLGSLAANAGIGYNHKPGVNQRVKENRIEIFGTFSGRKQVPFPAKRPGRLMSATAYLIKSK